MTPLLLAGAILLAGWAIISRIIDWLTDQFHPDAVCPCPACTVERTLP
jgi:hypothetical protein